jgi:hypothetical protein
MPQPDLKVLDDYPAYSIDTDGIIYSDVKGGPIARSHTLQGAPKVSLVDIDGKRRTLSVKALVARTFLPPHEHEHYDTPISLDGDQENCSVENLMWRPRFFANLYARQFAHNYKYYHQDRIFDLDTGEVYESIYNASVLNGILFKDVLRSVHNGPPVRCTHQRFAFE